MSRTKKQPEKSEKTELPVYMELEGDSWHDSTDLFNMAYELTPEGLISTLIDDKAAGQVIDALELHARRQVGSVGQVAAIVFDKAGGRFGLVESRTNG